MKVIIAGSRTFDNYHLFKTIMEEKIKSLPITEVISGMATGPDLMAVNLANVHCIPVQEFPADWDNYGVAAGYIRNVEMAESADYLIAFWDGKSKGTKHMIDTMKKQNKHGEVIMI